MTMRIVPNPGQTHEDLAREFGAHVHGPANSGPHVGPANLPNEPAFHRPPPGWTGPNPSYAQGPVNGPITPPEGLPGPIYPGPGWHVGPGVRAEMPKGKKWVEYSGVTGYGADGGAVSEIGEYVRFGIVDNGLLVIFALAGTAGDKWIAEKLNTPRGWGPVIGAGVGNAVSDFAAGVAADGWKPAIGVTIGCLLPLVPVFIAANVMKKKPEDKMTRNMLMGLSGAMVLGAFLKRK